MRPSLFESLDQRLFLSAAAGGSTTSSFADDWKKAQAIMSGEYFVPLGDANRDRVLTYAEQFTKAKKDLHDANGDGRVDVNDLHVPDRTKSSTMAEAIKYMDHVDWYETGRATGAHAWVNDQGVLAISGSGDMRVELSGKYVKYTEGGKQLARVTLKSIKRIDVFGGSKADTIRLAATGKPTTVYGRGGNDTVYGGDASDTIYGGAGNDQIHGGGGDDVIVGVDGDDRLWGDGGNDRLDGNAGKDHLDGGSGKNSLTGGGSIDYLTLRSKDKHDSDKSDKLSLIK